jgi:hypothetical protein
VKTQVWTALITMLMLRLMQLKSRWGWPLSNLVALLRMHLFSLIDVKVGAIAGVAVMLAEVVLLWLLQRSSAPAA